MSYVAKLTIIWTLALILAASLATADVPKTINYQGQLTDDQGDPITNTVSMIFTIYDAEVDGNSKWTETQPTVAVVDGLFDVALGSVVPIDDSVFNADQRWLQISVGGEIITPRTRLISTPYSHVASTVAIPLNIEGEDTLWTGLINVNVTGGGRGVFLNATSSANDALMATKDGANTAAILASNDAGVQGFVSGSPGGIAIMGQADGASNTGVIGTNDFSTWGYLGRDSIGVLGHVGNTEHWAVYGTNYGSDNYGYIGGDSSGVFGHGETSSDYAGLFEGKVHVDGAVTATTYHGDGSNLTGITASVSIPWEVTDSDPDGLVELTNEESEGVAIIAQNSTQGSYAYLGGTIAVSGQLGWNKGFLGTTHSGVKGMVDLYGSPSSVGVKGSNILSGNSGYIAGDSVGVFGHADDGEDYGIYGENETSNNSGYIAGDSVGVFGHAETGSDCAVFGENAATGCSGYLGWAKGVSGVHLASGNGGYIGDSEGGIRGLGNETSAYGVRGDNIVTGNYGYLGGENIGVYGIGAPSGMKGEHLTSGNYGIIGDVDYGIYAQGAGVGLYSSGGSTGIEAHGVSGVIAYAEHTAGTAVFGQNAVSYNYGLLGGPESGVYGEAGSSSYYAGQFNGKVYIDGDVGIGTTSPNGPIHIQSALNITSGSNFADRVAPLVIGDGDGAGYCILIDGNQIEMAYTDGLHINTASPEDVYLVNGGGNVGIGTNSPTEKLHVAGNICYTGAIGACSDVRYKKDIRQIGSALATVSKMRGITYNWKQDQYPEHNFDNQNHLGFIAQEIKELLPGVVLEDDNGYMSVDYGRLTPVLVEAMKELKAENNELRDRLEKIESLLEQIVNNKR